MAEIHIRNIPFECGEHELIRALADILHKPPFNSYSTLPINFDVHLARDRDNRRKHRGFGSLTLPYAALGEAFLRQYNNTSGFAPRQLFLSRRVIKFGPSKFAVKDSIVQSILRLPYQDPEVLEEQERRTQELQSSMVAVEVLQFGWHCHDDVFSIEWEHGVSGLANVIFSEENRELRLNIQHADHILSVVVRYTSILVLSAHTSPGNQSSQYAVWINLRAAPHFERQDTGSARQFTGLDELLMELFNTSSTRVQKRTRLQHLPYSGHSDTVSFASLSMRLVLPSLSALRDFRRLANLAKIPHMQDFVVRAESRGLFSLEVLNELRRWQQAMPWDVAYQIEGIMRQLLVDAKEMLKFIRPIREMIAQYGSRYTASFLTVFRESAANWWLQEDAEQEYVTIDDCFSQTQAEFVRSRPLASYSEVPVNVNVVQALHVTVTPTSMSLNGPYPEQNNRVLRSYPGFHENFLRVRFMEEGQTQFRFDRDIDGRAFIEDRVGTIMRRGLTIAGRKFEFLAYSMSALREHTVWFLYPFMHMKDGRSTLVNAESIIASLGTFPRQTLYCPARYAARISQAFTATDQATVEVEEVIYIDDIETPDGKSCFTDGVGTLSLEFARQIWAGLQTTRKRAGRSRGSPRAYQVRFQGSKGMLSVDHRLRGSVIMLRPSMKKFDAPDALYVEIARAFDTPGGYFLNRPLIMLLEGLGVPYSVFEEYQDAAVAEVRNSTGTLAGAGRLYEKYGLGTSFRVSSVLNNLAKLGLDHLFGDDFYAKMLEFAVHHVLRDIKNRARIPVPKGHSLVGVADVHDELEEGEIYACIKPKSGQTVYLKGPVLISRSPTIHPGDAQIAHAIGRPAPGSSFAIEPLPNMVVFSTKGARSLPSCLGGGDLDGDLYDLIPLNECPEFLPPRTSPAASYDAAPRKELNRPSTMSDVVDFVVDYINSDVLGIIAINWLITADQSSSGIFDEDCLTLSQLHSDAVDYPKSGMPVALDRIPRLQSQTRPDWNAPETVDVERTKRYYESQRAIGKLFRRVDLPVVNTNRESRRQRRRMRLTEERNVNDLVDSLSNIGLSDAQSSDSGSSDAFEEDIVQRVIRDRVDEFIDVGVVAAPLAREGVAQMFWNYADRLQGICSTNVLSHRRTTMLTEEEAVVGTILEKTSQPRLRKAAMSKLREHTDYLTKDVRVGLAAAEDEAHEVALTRAWLAWQLSLKEHELFGAKSFGWVALSSIFESIKAIEDRDKEANSNRGYRF